jgi:protein-S-isoprenylcysteine O-methyltransferase Ste14
MWTSLPDLIGPMWLAIFIIWGVSGLSVNNTVGSHSEARARVLVWIVMLAWFFLFNPKLQREIALSATFVPFGPAAVYTGFALTSSGLGFALWARFTIGRNWGGLITVQEGHKIVRSGPYSIVRHPIYSGFMLATLGTAIVFGTVGGLVSTALVMLSWGYKSRLEERYMVQQFGAEYEDYRRDVKGLIPGIW